MRGLSEKEFSDTLKECFLSVWVDDDSAFGTFPLESMASGVPVIGKIPKLNMDLHAEDFLILHYMTRKTNTDFWRDLANLEIPNSLGSKLERWQHKLPINEDFSHLSNYKLFGSDNFIMCMHGLGLFNRNSIKQEFESKSITIQEEANKLIQKQFEFNNSIESVTHKEMISLIRNYF
jgi:hypothetical protein